MRTDVVRTYKDIHTWVGIISGMALFIAFYAGALTMFEQQIERWASPPPILSAAPGLDKAPDLVAATIAAHPEAARNYRIQVTPTPEAPARMIWRLPDPAHPDDRRAFIQFASSFASDGSLEVAPLGKAPVADFIDVLHQQVGLPLEHEWAMPITGIIALLYAVALISGVIVLVPSLIGDLFTLRIGKNLKRMWLDVHNALGILSLPFHIIMALTAVVFAFHDQFYDTQNLVVYDGKLERMWDDHQPRPHHAEGTPLLTPAEIIARLATQAPGFQPTVLGYQNRRGDIDLRVEGVDPRYGMRAPTNGFVDIDPYDGRILDATYLPGHQPGWAATVTSFFMLHFGTYGGTPIRWAYFLLGLGGAFLFYSGNLLWIESRRRKERKAGAVEQTRAVKVMGALTVGVTLGSIAGISLTLAAAKWLPGRVDDVGAAHSLLYYALFVAAVGWALWRGAARAGVQLLWLCAFTTALIPLSSVLAAAGLGGWNHGGDALLVDVVAIVGVTGFALMARHARRRAADGPRDSIWSARPAPATVQVVAR